MSENENEFLSFYGYRFYDRNLRLPNNLTDTDRLRTFAQIYTHTYSISTWHWWQQRQNYFWNFVNFFLLMIVFFYRLVDFSTTFIEFFYLFYLNRAVYSRMAKGTGFSMLKIKVIEKGPKCLWTTRIEFLNGRFVVFLSSRTNLFLRATNLVRSPNFTRRWCTKSWILHWSQEGCRSRLGASGQFSICIRISLPS